jgi:hypothetical protein
MPKPAQEMWLNLALPGSALVVRGQLGLGLAILMPALLCAALAALSPMVAESGFALAVSGVAVAVYLTFGLGASVLYGMYFRPKPWDAERVRELHRAAAEAYLKNDPHDALSAALELVDMAPGEIGAWRLLALVAEAADDKRSLRRAERTVKRLRAAEDQAA